MIKYVLKDVPDGVVIEEATPISENEYLIDLVIPTELNGKKVVSIKKAAFIDKSSVDDEERPEFCKFEEDKILFNSITIPEGVEIEEETFYLASAKEIHLPASITKVPMFCFFRSRVEKVVFERPELVEEIGEAAFSECMYLKHFSWPPNCKELKDCFASSNLETLEGIENVETIQDAAFMGTCITELVWPSRCKVIPRDCFHDCSIKKLTGIENVTLISEYAFQGTENLKSFVWPSKCKNILTSCFENSGLRKITNIDHVSYIGEAAFRNTGLKNFSWPKGCKKIPDFCFASTKLKELTGLDSIREIGKFAFLYTHMDTIKISNPQRQITIHSSSFDDSRINTVDISDLSELKVIMDLNVISWKENIKSGFDTEVTLIECEES